MAKIERKYMAHYIDSSMGGTASYTRLGKDLEELNIEMNPDVEIFKNILGEQSVKHNGYEVSATAEPFYADESDDMFEPLQEIVDDRKLKYISGTKRRPLALTLLTERTAMSYRRLTAETRLDTRFRLKSTMLATV